MRCYRYIELNPVRADMVKRPEEYKWSSYGVNAWGDNSWLFPHDEYLKLGMTIDERCFAYRDLFKVELSEENLHLFRKSAHYNQPISDDRFREKIENKYRIRFGQAKRGRPRKQDNELVK